MKRFRVLPWMFCLMLLFSFAVSAQGESVVAAFVFDNTGAVMEANLEENGFGSKSGGYLAREGEGVIVASVSGTDLRKLEWTKDEYTGGSVSGMQPAMTGGNKNPWGEGAYLEVRVPTTGYDNIAFSAKLGGTNKGPQDYKLQYSTDGKTYKDVGAVYAIEDNKTLEQAFDHVALPADAAGCELLYIRMTVNSETLINGLQGLVGTTSGETAVNDVYVYGTPSASAGVASGIGFVPAACLIAAVLCAGIAVIVAVRHRKKA